MGMSFDFSQLYEALEDISNNIQNKTLDKALEAGEQPIIAKLEQNVSVDTGATKAAIGEIKKQGSGSNRKVLLGVNTQDREIIERAYYLEHGNECQVGTHWMKKSFYQGKEEAEEKIVKTLKEELGL